MTAAYLIVMRPAVAPSHRGYAGLRSLQYEPEGRTGHARRNGLLRSRHRIAKAGSLAEEEVAGRSDHSVWIILGVVGEMNWPNLVAQRRRARALSS